MPEYAETVAFFVYGTLKRGECREHCWPRPPLEILPGTIAAELYDLGPYPAIRPGNDRVLGEIWRVAGEDLAETVRILDEIEGFSGGANDLYVRRKVSATTTAGEKFQAWTYFFARDFGCTTARRIAPGTDGLCRWNG